MPVDAWLSEQVFELNDPALSVENVTVPAGVEGVPASVSVTVPVQVVGALTGTDEGVQLTVTEVARTVAVSENFVAVLVEWSVSPP